MKPQGLWVKAEIRSIVRWMEMLAVKIAVRCVAVSWALAVLAMPAFAAPFGHGRDGGRPGFAGGQPAPREMPRDLQQRPSYQRNVADERMQRLSPDERRELRRDIRDAGREIYRPQR